MLGRFTLLGLFAALLCATPVAADEKADEKTNQVETPLRWPKVTRSPRSGPTPRGRDAALYRLCGAYERGLVRVAAAVVGRKVEGHPPPTQRQMSTLLRSAGVPQLWPRAWALSGKHSDAVIAQRMESWLDKGDSVGAHRAPQRRCGIARGVNAAGEPVIAMLVVNPMADLKALPTKIRPSRWTSLEATLHVPATSVKVVLLGPSGRPKRVLASLSNGKIRSRFTLDQPGRWKVQVVANLPDGPKPVLEALVFAGIDPPDVLAEATDTKAETAPSAGKLVRLLNQARRGERLPRLKRDKALDQLARQHARQMMMTRRVSHDVGEGGPKQRASDAGVRAHNVGENVARAPTLSRIHHALWDSPSHRENMLDASFRRVGAALAIDRRGQLYAVQIFAD
jgi:uncharacterized protein YkwD